MPRYALPKFGLVPRPRQIHSDGTEEESAVEYEFPEKVQNTFLYIAEIPSFRVFLAFLIFIE